MNRLPSHIKPEYGVVIVTVLYVLLGIILTAISILAPPLRIPFEIIFGIIGFGACIWLVTLTPSPMLSYRKWLLIVIGVSIAFQLMRWVADGGALANRLGDDDQIYIMLAHQIAGLLEGRPTFTFRPPGLPALIAASMWLGGGSSAWIFSLVQRLMLAAIPPMLFIILRHRLQPCIAAFASMLYLLTEINEIYPSLALTEISYTFGTVLVIMLLLVYVRQQHWGWLVAVGFVLALRVLLRPSGLASSIAMLLAIMLIVRNWKQLAVASTLLIVPSLFAILLIGQLNKAVMGRAVVTDLSGLNIILHIGHLAVPLEDTQAKDFFSERLPEAELDDVLAARDDIYVIRHRAILEGTDSLAAYSQNSEQLARQIVQSHPWLFAEIVGRRVTAGILYPREELYPQRWIIQQNTLPNRDYEDPQMECRAQTAVARDLFDTICVTSDIARAATQYEPPWLEVSPILETIFQGATVSFHYRLRLISWPFTWGLIAIPAMLYLIFKTRLWPEGLVLAGLFCAEFLPTVLYVPIDSRYQLLYAPLFLLAIWFSLIEIKSSRGAAPTSQ